MATEKKTNDKIEKPTYRKTEKKVIQVKLNPQEGSKIHFAASSSLGESAVIALASANNQMSITIHRPIGWTSIGDDTWVMSETSDIPSFLLKVEHPKEKEFNEQAYKFAIDECVKAGLLERSTNDKLVYPGTGMERANFRKLIEKLKKFNEKQVDWTKNPDPAKPPKRPEGLPEGWLPDNKILDAEATIAKSLKENLAKFHETNKISSYETTGGAYGNKRQRPIRGSKGQRLVEVCESVMNTLLSMTEDPSKGPAVNPRASEKSDKHEEKESKIERSGSNSKKKAPKT